LRRHKDGEGDSNVGTAVLLGSFITAIAIHASFRLKFLELFFFSFVSVAPAFTIDYFEEWSAANKGGTATIECSSTYVNAKIIE
jgi:hypothetical protein